MDGGAAAIEALVQNLINVCKEEISLIRGVEKDAEQLKTTLELIRSYLNDAEKKFITQEAVKTWLKDIEEVAFNADNVLDELNYHALHNEVKAMKPMMNNALSCFSSFHHMIVCPHQMALTIKEINSSFDSINKRATELHLQSMVEDAPPAVPDAAFETNSFTNDPVFIGRDDDVPKLVEVMTESPEERIFSILAVVGMGGMGKTTLTRKIFNHQKMKTQFGCHSWVHVSQTFNPLIIFKKFLASLPSQTDEDKRRELATEEKDNEPTWSKQAGSLKLQKSFKGKTDEVETRQGILEKLQEALKGKTYLLVLDDIWNRDLPNWTDFIDSLSGITSTKGNGIIFTTRSTEVASIMKPLETHRLNALSEEDCWSIIKAKAFEMGDVIPPEFESIGRNIARRCQGLPLAAKVVGGVLSRKSEQEWLSVEQKWLSDVEGDYISRILRLSYDNLSLPSLKKCFAYCSIFPKGHRMVKNKLIELWMAEGLLQSDERNDMESMGDKFVNVLLHNSLLQAVPSNYGEKENEEICVMHDLVHELAISILGSLKVRYMRHGDESSSIPKETAKYLRSLFIQGKVSEFKLSDFKCLHVLSFDGGSNQHVKFLSSSIGKLIHLRKLDISETRIKYLPDSIGELHHLQTLRADTYSLRKLPKTLNNLIQLRHLFICDVVKLPPKIGRLTSLQTLSQFRVSRKNGCQIEELGSLKNLKGKLKIFNLEKVKGKEEAEKANIFQNPDLFGLTFQWGYRLTECDVNDENVLEGLQPHPNLKKLAIIGFKGKRFPSWTLNMAVREGPQGSWVGLKKLVTITLYDCRECEEIPTLGHLPNLKHLRLEGFHNVKSINSSFYGIDNNIGVQQETIVVFPVLERFELDDMPNLIEWAEVQFPNETETLSHEVKVFPRLKYLEINGCQKLENFGKCLENICGVTLSLTSLHIGRAYGLECLPDWLFHNNQNLSKLEISECPKLRELPDGLHTLKSLEELKIKDCPNLKSIGISSGSRGRSQGTLRRLLIRNCDALMDLPHEMVESWAPSLGEVSLSHLSSLTNLPKVIECFAKSARLTELSIVGVPKFMAARSVERWPFSSLRKLKIDASVEWSRESSFAIKETVDGILRGCSHSLVELSLTGLEIWECLPESIQNLTSVSSLTLHNFGIEELPVWFGNLSSLEWLELHNFGIEELPEWFGNLSSSLSLSKCKKLRHLGGRDALRRLTKLRHLYIDDCPELSFIDFEWRRNNIPHVYIRVDGHDILSCTELCVRICILCLCPSSILCLCPNLILRLCPSSILILCV